MDADELVRRYVMRTYRNKGEVTRNRVYEPMGWPTPNEHLLTCPDADVVQAEAYPTKFWETGVTGLEFTAVVGCPHGERHEFEFGQLGTLADIIDDMDRDARGAYSLWPFGPASRPGSATLRRHDDGTRTVERADDLILVDKELLQGDLSGDAIEPDGTLRLDTAGAWRYRYVRDLDDKTALYERIKTGP